jgi:hypothetical protein
LISVGKEKKTHHGKIAFPALEKPPGYCRHSSSVLGDHGSLHSCQVRGKNGSFMFLSTLETQFKSIGMEIV